MDKGKITEDYEVLFPLSNPELAILGHFDINSIFSLFQITFPHLLHVIWFSFTQTKIKHMAQRDKRTSLI